MLHALYEVVLPPALLPFTHFSIFKLSTKYHPTDLTLPNKTGHVNPPLDASITQAHMSLTPGTGSAASTMPDPSAVSGTTLAEAAVPFDVNLLCNNHPDLSELIKWTTRVETCKAEVDKESDELLTRAKLLSHTKEYKQFNQQYNAVFSCVLKARDLIIDTKWAAKHLHSTRCQLSEIQTMHDLKAFTSQLESFTSKLKNRVTQLEVHGSILRRLLDDCQSNLANWSVAKEALTAAMTAASGSSTSVTT